MILIEWYDLIKKPNACFKPREIARTWKKSTLFEFRMEVKSETAARVASV
jgi:hypothetical protein